METEAKRGEAEGEETGNVEAEVGEEDAGVGNGTAKEKAGSLEEVIESADGGNVEHERGGRESQGYQQRQHRDGDGV
ncbi:UNVERIFIED_CONTAM: hypothetical protein Sindi_1952100 [Sesamum indicum]